jgi:hypothetical protein
MGAFEELNQALCKAPELGKSQVFPHKITLHQE